MKLFEISSNENRYYQATTKAAGEYRKLSERRLKKYAQAGQYPHDKIKAQEERDREIETQILNFANMFQKGIPYAVSAFRRLPTSITLFLMYIYDKSGFDFVKDSGNNKFIKDEQDRMFRQKYLKPQSKI